MEKRKLNSDCDLGSRSVDVNDKRRRVQSSGGGKESKKQKYETFESFGLSDNLLRGLFSNGFERPSAIQAKALPVLLQGRDVVAQAQSGTGKTAMSALVALHFANSNSNHVQTLVLSPTRELAQQTLNTAVKLSSYTAIQCFGLVGGTSVSADVSALNRSGIHMISATPGRAYDLIRRGALDLSKLKLLLIDEADEMLGRGFKEQIYEIYRRVPSQVQVVLVSATMPRDVVMMSEQFLTEPVKILVKKDALSLDGIAQFYVDVEQEKYKFGTLCDLYETLTVAQAVVFVNTKQKCEWLAKKMKKNAFTVSLMHGDLSQKERECVMQSFRDGEARVLVATDVWSRGIDVQQVTLVVNFDVPTNYESYLHRIGRSGRFGRKGIAISFVTKDDENVFHEIERFYSIKISELPSDVSSLL
mmetsp:Transcript_10386/g.18719  ORF Transcript_10386/g.18719 Transcript_10386/m.18719 type:complete len:416 (-) Transcript_10386:372-1619(-)|eukprot:CAMPEP_0182450024 /NCGR_PEP_ID=MMETSP1172-20130603/38431_1 /TAXON_ID=708627 /ORGANISM="Timspurckia oligopyrenoides, Strain CCMP3278" /LENGTH=415 /DNA_ID=CAMNT_0024647497 /DNA_START=280 /DNA_END=1527 /DNA_ORIENTATION=+